MNLYLTHLELTKVYNEDGNSLYTSYVTFTEDTSSESYYDDIELDRLILRKHFNVNNVIFTVTKEDSYEYEDIADKSTLLYNNGLISEEEYAENIAEYFLSSNTENNISMKTDGTCLYLTLKDYCESHNENEISPIVETALDAIGVQSLSATSYVTVGRFRVYYDSSSVSYSAALKVADEFDTADIVFCDTVGLKKPKSSISSSYYRVNLVDSATDGVTTYENKNLTSEINISNAVAKYFSDIGSCYTIGRNGSAVSIPGNA